MDDGRMELALAREKVGRLADMLRDTCERIEVAGSIRRGKDTVKDAELVAIGRGSDLMDRLDQMVSAGTISKALYGEKGLTRWGAAYRGLVFDGLRVEIFGADGNSWGNQYWLRTGPGDANQFIMKWLIWKRAPLRFQDGHVWSSANWQSVKDGWRAADRVKLALREEADFFAVMGMPEIEPGMRSDAVYRQILSNREHRLPDMRQWFVQDAQDALMPIAPTVGTGQRVVDPLVKAAERDYVAACMRRHEAIFERVARGEALAEWEQRIVENRKGRRP